MGREVRGSYTVYNILETVNVKSSSIFPPKSGYRNVGGALCLTVGVRQPQWECIYIAKHFEFLLKNLVAADHRQVEQERETSRREFGVCLT